MSYSYDEHNDQIVYPDGRRIPRPQERSIEALHASTSIPRSMPQLPATSAPRSQPTNSPSSHSYLDPQSPLQELTISPSQRSLRNLPPAPPQLQNHTPRRPEDSSFSSNQIWTQVRPPSIHTQGDQSHRFLQGWQSRQPKDSSSDSPVQVIRKQEPDESSKLYSNFKRPTKPRKFFKLGKVFLTLWAEPAGEPKAIGGSSRPRSTSGISTGSYGESVFSKIRRFIVVREGGESCTALMIKTYGGDGVSRKGVRKCEHAVIYTGKKAPPRDSRENPARDEDGLLPLPIRVDADHPTEKLDEMSRIDFGKVYTIEHNVKVRSLGKVNSDSVQPLLSQMRLTWASSTGMLRTNETGSYSLVEWTSAYQILVDNGWPDARARAILRSDFQFIQVPSGEQESRGNQLTTARSEGSSKDSSELRTGSKDKAREGPKD